MDIEERGDALGRLLREARRQGTRDWLTAHTYQDARRLTNDGLTNVAIRLSWRLSRPPVSQCTDATLNRTDVRQHRTDTRKEDCTETRQMFRTNPR